MLTKPDRYGHGNLDRPLDHEEYSERIQNNGKDAIAQVIQDGDAQEHPYDAGYGQHPPDRFQGTGSKQKKDEPDHDIFGSLPVLILQSNARQIEDRPPFN